MLGSWRSKRERNDPGSDSDSPDSASFNFPRRIGNGHSEKDDNEEQAQGKLASFASRFRAVRSVDGEEPAGRVQSFASRFRRHSLTGLVSHESSRWTTDGGNGRWGLRRLGSYGSITASVTTRASNDFGQNVKGCLRIVLCPNCSSSASPAEKLVLGVFVFFLTWLVFASAALVMNSVIYQSAAVDEARSRFLWACAERVSREAESVLSVAMLVRNAMHYSVSRQFYYDPLDYQAARSALEPVFMARPSLRSVELAFTDRAESISLIRQYRRPPTESTDAVILQSDAEDCATLGPWGCSPHKPARERAWYPASLELKNWETDIDHSQDYYYHSYYTSETASRGFMWLDTLGFLRFVNVRMNGTEAEEMPQEAGSVKWTTAGSLVFRVIFPGTSRHVSVLGHVVVEVGDLRNMLGLRNEATLGRRGGIFIIDRVGTVVAAYELGNQVMVEGGSGDIRFRHLSELGEDWAQQLSGDVRNAAMRSARSHGLAEGFDVVSLPLSADLSHFSVVVAAERDPFVDGTLEGMSSVVFTVVWMPIPFVALVFAIWCGHREVGRRRKQRRVQVVEEALQSLRTAERHGVAPDPRNIKFTTMFEETPDSPGLPKKNFW
mmetsp:Transcript_30018/g.54703  ORF Transcript_30018/g.54703 Transcript_30018/m.54703 type:complete len:608 (-) Transcript_30018:41-1864(-)